MNISPLYWANALFLICPSDVYFGFILCLAAHFSLFAFFSYKYFRAARFGAEGALLAALSLACGPYFFSTSNLFNIACSMVALPGFLWVREKKDSWSFLAGSGLAAFFLAWPIYAGDPQFTYWMALYLIGAELWSAYRRRETKPVFRLGVTGLLAVILSAGQIVPSFELLGQSARFSTQATLAAMELLSFHPARLIDLLLPLPFGTHFGAHPYADKDPLLFSPYIGSLFILLFFSSLRRRRRVSIALILAIFLIVASCGNYLGAFDLYRVLFWVVPGWKFFRYPERLVLPAVFALVVAYGSSWRLFARSQFKLKSKFLPLSAAMAIFFLAPLLRAEMSPFASSLCRSLLFLCLFLWIQGAHFFSKKLKQTLLCLSVTLELLPLGQSLLWTVPADLIPIYKNPVAEKILDHQKKNEALLNLGAANRYFHGTFRGTYRSEAPDPRVRGEIQDWSILFPNTHLWFGLSSPVGYTSFDPMEVISEWLEESRENPARLMDLHSIAYFVTSNKAGEIETKFNTQALPLVWLPSQQQSPRENTSTRALVYAPSRKYREEVILADGKSGVMATAPGWKIQKMSASPDDLSLEVGGGRKGILTVVWNERRNPYWIARFDGKSTPIYTANDWAMAISEESVDEASHIVEFHYRDPWAYIAWYLSLSALLGLSAYVVLQMRKKRKV